MSYRPDLLASDVTAQTKEGHQANVLLGGGDAEETCPNRIWICHPLFHIYVPSLLPFSRTTPMSGDLELDAEFSAIMAANMSRPTLHRPVNAPPNWGYGPSRVHPSGERASSHPSIQAVCFLLTPFLPLVLLVDDVQRDMTQS